MRRALRRKKFNAVETQESVIHSSSSQSLIRMTAQGSPQQNDRRFIKHY